MGTPERPCPPAYTIGRGRARSVRRSGGVGAARPGTGPRATRDSRFRNDFVFQTSRRRASLAFLGQGRCQRHHGTFPKLHQPRSVRDRRRRVQRLCRWPAASPTSPSRRPASGRARRGMSSGSACWSRTASCCTRPAAVQPARSRHRGRRASASAAEAGAIWRRALHRRPHGADDRTAAFRSAKRISSSARATSSASATAPRRPTPRCASIGSPARRPSPKARISSSTPSSISSSTITCRCSKPSRRRSTRSRTGY